MLIRFVHTGKAFLPEIDAYRQFFEQHAINTVVDRPRQNSSAKPDVEWWFMGKQFSGKNKSAVLIHEYASSSLPPFRRWKDLIKRTLNVKPDFRLFLNEYTQSQLGFNDDIPQGLRDMGINIPEMGNTKTEKKYDFIYCGSVSKDMHFEKLLECFTKEGLNEKTLLVLSNGYQEYQQKHLPYRNIFFEGPVAQQQVASHIRSARFAINYKPDIEPHNHQTSTKLLEYAACGIPIITTDFFWMRQFQEKWGGMYFYLKPDLSNFGWEAISQFNYANPDLSHWSWENQIRRSGVLEFLTSKFSEISF